MKNKIISTAVILLSSISLALAGGEGWITDLDEGIALAKKEGKPVLAEFTGSDWCPPCMMMQKKVFSKEEFVKGASEDYILVIVDSPKSDKALREKNDKYFKKYKIKGVPTVALIDAEGNAFESFNATSYPSVDKFLAKLKASLPAKTL